MTNEARSSSPKSTETPFDDGNFAALLQNEFRPRSQARENRIAAAVRTLADQALADGAAVEDSLHRTLDTMIGALDRKIHEQLDVILQNTMLNSVESAWRGLIDLSERMPTTPIRVLDMTDEAREHLFEDRDAAIFEGGGIGALVSREKALDRLDEITVGTGDVDWIASPVLGAGDMARHLGVARASLDNWRRAHRTLALRKGVRNYVYPTRQFGRNAPIAGLDRVRAFFGSDETCWEWLVSPNRHTAGKAPIDQLRLGKIADVARAAEGASDVQ